MLTRRRGWRSGGDWTHERFGVGSGLTRRGVMGLAAAGLALGGLPAEAASPRRKKATQVVERVVPLAERDDLIGHIEYYVTDGQTTLLEVAHHYDIGVPHISALNPGVDAWVPGSGRTLRSRPPTSCRTRRTKAS